MANGQLLCINIVLFAIVYYMIALLQAHNLDDIREDINELKQDIRNLKQDMTVGIKQWLYHTVWEVKRNHHRVQIPCTPWRHL